MNSGNRIIIKKLKGINSLDFEIPKPGTHIITASNGCGKTTLITCITRLTNKNVFRDNFKQHKSSNVRFV
jgi:ABC-type cobalamin/Fe3+-siderophores transport system ATPase subunit